MIPPEAMTILATIGLTPDQAVQVARAFNLIEQAYEAVAQEQRAANAARQARFRERHITSHNVMSRHITPTVPHARAFCTGEEVDINPLSSPSAQTSPKGDVRRGTRLPEDWAPSEAHYDEGRRLGVSREAIDQIADEFRNYWVALPGAKARKLDWGRTFINRLRDQAARYNRQRNPNGQGSLIEAGIRAIRRAEERGVRGEAGGSLRDDAIRLLSKG